MNMNATMYQLKILLKAAVFLVVIITLQLTSCVSSLTSTPPTTTTYWPDTTPGEVHNLHTTYVASESVGLSWGAPNKTTMTGYAIFIHRGDICETGIFLACPPYGVYEEGLPCEYNNAQSAPCYDVMYYNVTDVESYSDYTLRVVATNKYIVGYNSSLRVHTKIGISAPPSNVQGRPLNNSAILVEWTIPSHQAGPTIYIIRVLEALSRKADSTYNHTATYNVSGYTTASYTVAGLLSSWRYKFEVTARTTVGMSRFASSSAVTTLQSSPEAVQNMTVNYVTDHYMAVMVSWECPPERQRNGRITNYTVAYIGNVSLTVDVGSYYPEDPCMEPHHVLLPVQPNVKYIMAVTANAEFTGKENTLNFYADLNKMKYIVHPVSNGTVTESNSDTLYTVSGVCGSIIVILLIMIGLLYYSKDKPYRAF